MVACAGRLWAGNRTGVAPPPEGSLRDLWRFSFWCTGGLRLAHSRTRCAGATQQACAYTCDEGPSNGPRHVATCVDG